MTFTDGTSKWHPHVARVNLEASRVGGDDDVICFASYNTRFDSGKVHYCKRLPMMLQDCEIIRPMQDYDKITIRLRQNNQRHTGPSMTHPQLINCNGSSCAAIVTNFLIDVIDGLLVGIKDLCHMTWFGFHEHV